MKGFWSGRWLTPRCRSHLSDQLINPAATHTHTCTQHAHTKNAWCHWGLFFFLSIDCWCQTIPAELCCLVPETGFLSVTCIQWQQGGRASPVILEKKLTIKYNQCCYFDICSQIDYKVKSHQVRQTVCLTHSRGRLWARRFLRYSAAAGEEERTTNFLCWLANLLQFQRVEHFVHIDVWLTAIGYN